MYVEVDLKRVFRAVVQNALGILVSAVVAALAAAMVTQLFPKIYTARATVLAVIPQTTMSLNASGGLENVETRDVESLRVGLVALVQTEAVEAQLPREVIAQLAPTNYSPGSFINNKFIGGWGQGELIHIVATGHTAMSAQLLAQSWRDVYITQAQRIYKDQAVTLQPIGDAGLPLAPAPVPIVRNAGLAGAAALMLSVLVILISSVWVGVRGSAKPKLHPIQS